jgi:two-component system, chemotaxis family, CheB/CheR fusion protein
MEHHAPAYFVIDQNYETLRFSGGEVRHFLEPSSGVASLNLFSILLKSLRPAVRAAILRAVSLQETVIVEDLPVRIDGKLRDVTLIVEPLVETASKPSGICVIAFRDTSRNAKEESIDSKASVTGGASAALQKELLATRGQLKASNDELETTVEDMRSAEEEFQVMNEELQSANEELETAKEEMQSVNEELQTVNTELASKNDQMARLNSDLKNLLDSTRVAAVFLDDELHIRHFTPALTEIFPLRESDRGRPITEIVNLVDYADLTRDVAEVRQSQSIIERDVKLSDRSATFLMRIRPYRTVTDAIDGVVVTFFDITQRSLEDDQKQMIAKELQHRTGNLIAVILSIVNRTLAGDRPIEVAREVLAARLIALAKAHALLTADIDEGAGLEEIARVELASFADRATIQGPRVVLTPAATQGFAMIVHELATNAAKHGSLSNTKGCVSINWSLTDVVEAGMQLQFHWQERDGPFVQTPAHIGFGTKLLERAVNTFDQPAVLKYAPEGFTYDLNVPISSVATPAWLTASRRRDSL